MYDGLESRESKYSYMLLCMVSSMSAQHIYFVHGWEEKEIEIEYF